MTCTKLRSFFETKGWDWPKNHKFRAVSEMLRGSLELYNQMTDHKPPVDAEIVVDGNGFDVMHIVEGRVTGTLKSIDGRKIRVKDMSLFRGIVKLPNGSLVEIFAQQTEVEPFIAVSLVAMPYKIKSFVPTEIIV